MARNEIVIRIVIPRWMWRRWALLAGALILVGATAAYAIDITWIAKGKPLTAQNLSDNFKEIESRLQALETKAPLCPRGYTQFTDNNFPNAILCKNGNDEMVRVGGWPGKTNGPEVFWIDRYEASVWDQPGGMGNKPYDSLVNNGNPVAAGFPLNGQFATNSPLFAASVKAVPPTTSITWFQAEAACRLAGKHLATDQEWLAAAVGTPDPGANNGNKNALCNTQSAVNEPRNTGEGSLCASNWGAQDMIGNAWEWTANWYAGAGDTLGKQLINQSLSWPALFNGDLTYNVAAHTNVGNTPAEGIPAAAIRGGPWDGGQTAGVFAVSLGIAPSYTSYYVGFRCAAR